MLHMPWKSLQKIRDFITPLQYYQNLVQAVKSQPSNTQTQNLLAENLIHLTKLCYGWAKRAGNYHLQLNIDCHCEDWHIVDQIEAIM